MTDKPVSTADAIKKLEEKDGEANNESARTNELLAARAAEGEDSDPVAASIKANDPSLSRSAYTSAKSGFNEDLDRDNVETAKPARKSQAKTVNK